MGENSPNPVTLSAMHNEVAAVASSSFWKQKNFRDRNYSVCEARRVTRLDEYFRLLGNCCFWGQVFVEKLQKQHTFLTHFFHKVSILT
jgi:hypothetical protein